MTGKAEKKSPPKEIIKKQTNRTTIKKKASRPKVSKTQERIKKNKALFLECYVNSMNISEACKKIGIGRQTFYDWLKNDSAFKESFEDAEDSLIDFSEGQLRKEIGARNLTAIIFHLKTRGKSRGYIEPSNMTLQGEMSVSHKADMSLKELKESYDRLQRKNKK